MPGKLIRQCKKLKPFFKRFRARLKQVHMSYVNSQSRHERLNTKALAYRLVAHWLGKSVPVILETPVQKDEVEEEIARLRRCSQIQITVKMTFIFAD